MDPMCPLHEQIRQEFTDTDVTRIDIEKVKRWFDLAMQIMAMIIPLLAAHAATKAVRGMTDTPTPTPKPDGLIDE